MKTFLLLLVVITLAVMLRSLHFASSFNFSHDQGAFSLEALNIWQAKKLVLLGPTFSINVNGRYAYQGSAIYYMQLFFLLLGGFEPIASSYFFMLFATVMIVPLYYGAKWLLSQKAAWFLIILYAFFPMYIDYTKFLWNPTFQFALFPLVVFLMGLYAHLPSKKVFFVLSILLGFVLQFHYQFLLVLISIFSYYFFWERKNWQYLLLFVGGVALGFAPLILFELRNDFYNLKTIMLFLQHIGNQKDGTSFTFAPHYVLTLSFVGFMGLSFTLKHLSHKMSTRFLSIMTIGLLIIDLSIFLPRPTQAFGMAQNWNFLLEQKSAELILADNTTNFNVTNLVYDTRATVQKYLLTAAGKKEAFENYTSEQYLYVITSHQDFLNDPAYEVRAFLPALIEKEWAIDERHMLFRLKRR